MRLSGASAVLSSGSSLRPEAPPDQTESERGPVIGCSRSSGADAIRSSPRAARGRDGLLGQVEDRPQVLQKTRWWPLISSFIIWAVTET